MPQVYFDLLYCSIFLVVLFAVFRIRLSARKSDHPAYDKIMWGTLFFVLSGGLKAAGSAGIMASVPVLATAEYVVMIEAAFIVAGLVMIILGAAALMPSLIPMKKQHHSLNRRYFALKMITQAIAGNSSLAASYSTVTNILTTFLGFDGCAAYLLSRRKNRLELSQLTGFARELPNIPRHIEITRELETVVAPNCSGRWMSDAAVFPRKPSIIIPVGQHDKNYGVIFCWAAPEMVLDDDMLDLLTTIGDELGRQAGVQIIETRRKYHTEQHTAFQRLSSLCTKASSVKQILPELFTVMKDIVGAEYLSVAALDTSGENMLRHTIGSGGRVLLEKGVSRSTLGSEVHTVFSTGRPQVTAHVNNSGEHDPEDGLFLACGMHSKIVHPIMAGNRVHGVLTLGHSTPGYFTWNHLGRLEHLTLLLGAVLQREQLHRSLEIREDHFLHLQQFERDLIDGVTLQQIFDNACDLLTSQMKCTIARLSLLDDKSITLRSRSAKTIRDIAQGEQGRSEIPLSMLPWHKMAIDSRKVMLINQQDTQTRMTAQESSATLMPSINSALLVPIAHGDGIQGIISVGEARNWNRRSFGTSDLMFARTVADICSLALQRRQLEENVEKIQVEMKSHRCHNGDRQPSLRAHLAGPVSSIIGTVELLKRTRDDDDDARHQYERILSSANRLKKILDQDNVTTPVTETRREHVDEEPVELVLG